MKKYILIILLISTAMWAKDSQRAISVTSKFGQKLIEVSQSVSIPGSEEFTSNNAQITVGQVVEESAKVSYDTSTDIIQYLYPDTNTMVTAINYTFYPVDYKNYIVVAVCVVTDYKGDNFKSVELQFFIKVEGKPIKIFEGAEATAQITKAWVIATDESLGKE